MDFEQMYRDYVYRREGLELVKFDSGFILYKIQKDNSVYISDMYTAPQYRGAGIMLKKYQQLESQLVNQGHSIFYVSVWLDDKNKDKNLKSTIKNGYTFYNSDNEMIFLKKEIKNGQKT